MALVVVTKEQGQKTNKGGKKMKKMIRFPMYNGGGYKCLDDVVGAFKDETWNRLSLYICDIVEYNVEYRDCLRKDGIEGLIMDYPKFDSSDACDDRSYDNYIIRKREITNTDMNRLFKVPSCRNAMRIHETIPTELLPVLYYGGSEDYMLLASAKS